MTDTALSMMGDMTTGTIAVVIGLIGVLAIMLVLFRSR